MFSRLAFLAILKYNIITLYFIGVIYMSRNIIIAGAGHGGLVAGYYLAQNGYHVTVYEKGKKNHLGYPQYDAVHLDGFEEAGIPVPEEYMVKRTPITFSVLGTDLPPITQGDSGDTYNVEIDRKALYKYLIGMAEEAGVKFVYGCEIIEPIILGSRVAGLRTSKGDVYGDLIIDACGLYSPVRSKLPEFMNITSRPGQFDVLHTYRAYYSRLKNAPVPAHKYLVSLTPGDSCGLLWAITNEDAIDVFVGTFCELTQELLDEKLSLLREVTPHLGKKLVRGGEGIVDIPIRQPLSIMVADGYAAIGDAAFMTIPIKGSGIGYSMRAGRILAECVMGDENGLYNEETLWKYQIRYFNEIGSNSAILAIIKNLFPVITMDDLIYLFGESIISSEDLEKFGSEAGVSKIIASLKPGEIRDKAKKLIGNQNVRRMLTGTAKNIAMYKIVEQSLKENFSSASAKKWADAYDNFFESIKE